MMKKTIYLFVLSAFLLLCCKKSDNKIDPELKIEIKGVSAGVMG